MRRAPNHIAVDVTCPHCGDAFEVDYFVGLKGRTYGRPEDCYPEEPAEFDIPDECPECGGSFSKEDIERMEEDADGTEGRDDDDRY